MVWLEGSHHIPGPQHLGFHENHSQLRLTKFGFPSGMDTFRKYPLRIQKSPKKKQKSPVILWPGDAMGCFDHQSYLTMEKHHSWKEIHLQRGPYCIAMLLQQSVSSWWFQPIWNICSSKLDHFPNFRGENWKKSLKPPPSSPECMHRVLTNHPRLDRPPRFFRRVFFETKHQRSVTWSLGKSYHKHDTKALVIDADGWLVEGPANGYGWVNSNL